MMEFAFSLAIFLLAHMVPTAPPVRARLTTAFGRRGYLLLYSVVSIALLAWIIVAALRAPYIPLWDPSPWQWWAAFVLMPFALFLLLAGLAAVNPLSVSLRKTRSGHRPSGITALTRHPVLWGFGLWALAHIPPNGHLVAVILFGIMALLAFAGMRIVDLKAQRRLGSEWHAMARHSPLVPLATPVSRGALAHLEPRTLLMGLAAIALYAWFILDGHTRLIGLDPLAGL
jgi:uncharacterized membrane protein